jgi:Glycine zipper
MNGTPAIGGWTIIQTGSKHITRNGPRTAIGTTNIIGTIGTGGKNTTQIGRANIITIGSKDLDAGSLHSAGFRRSTNTKRATPRINCVVSRLGDVSRMDDTRSGENEMKSNRLMSLLLAMFLLSAVAGCSDTGLGAAAGAGGGALVGSSVGHPWLGALVGGTGGAVVGHEIGEHKKGDDH